MEGKSRCYYCKIQVVLTDNQGEFIEKDKILSLLPHQDEKIMETDRVLLLSSLEFPDRQLVCLNCLENLFDPVLKEIDVASQNKKSLEEHLSLFKKELAERSENDSDDETILKLEETLKAMKSKSEDLSKELTVLEENLTGLRNDEQNYWAIANSTEMDLLTFEEKHSEVTQRLKVAEDEIKYLSNINVLNELFYISTSNQFGTISGLRLGRLDSEVVTWDEINAAWGHCVLLLSTLFKMKGLSSAQCILYPLGNSSKICQVHDSDRKYELFLNDTSYSKMSGRYNTAQELFIEVIYELSLMLEADNQDLSLPVKIERNLFIINNVKIRLDVSNKETWTRGLKYMLQDLKYLIYICIREDNKN
jgi:beclin 1